MTRRDEHLKPLLDSLPPGGINMGVDGSGFAKFRNAMMPKGLAALDQQVMEVGA